MNFLDDIEFIYTADEPQTRTKKISMRRNYYGIQLIYKGCIIFNGQKYTAPCFFILSPEKTYNYGPDDKEKYRSHIYICFKGSRIKNYLNQGLLPPLASNIPLPVPNASLLYTLMKNIIYLNKSDGKLNHLKAVALLDFLILELQEIASSQQKQPPLCQTIKKLIEKIQQHPELHWNFSQEAKMMEISTVYFNRLFHQCASMPPHRFLTECRLNQASDLLVKTRMQIREIAFACGYTDELYFSRQFRQYRLYSPRQFRQNFFQL